MRQSRTFPDCRILTSSWDDKDTQALLEILDSQEVKATFFVVGEWAQRCPDSVKALHQSGHEIMNHSATHPHLSQCSHEELINQVTKGNQMISALTGETPTLFRCPYGEYSNEIITTVRSLGMTPVQWDVEALERVGVRLFRPVRWCLPESCIQLCIAGITGVNFCGGDGMKKQYPGKSILPAYVLPPHHTHYGKELIPCTSATAIRTSPSPWSIRPSGCAAYWS